MISTYYSILILIFIHSQYGITNADSTASETMQNSIESLITMNNYITIPSKRHKPLKSYEICKKCRDTNSHIRDASLMPTIEPPFRQKYALSLKFQEIDEINGEYVPKQTKDIFILDHFTYKLQAIVFILILVVIGLILYIYHLKTSSSNNDDNNVSFNTSNTSIIESNESINDDNPMIDNISSTPPSKDRLPPKHHYITSPTIIQRRNEFLKHNYFNSAINSKEGSIYSDSSLTQPFSPSLADSNSDFELLSPEAKRTKKIQKISDLVLKQAKKASTKEDFKNDLAFILFVCNIVETRILKKDDINKKRLVMETLMKLFPYNDEEISNLDKNIEFLHSNGLIKKDTIIKQMQSYWSKRKL